MRDLKIWQQSLKWYMDDIGHILCIVVDSQGSSPGKQGFKMIINQDGKFHGTIGGGIMEANIQAICQSMLKSQIIKISVKELLHNKKTDKLLQSGLICSGRQTVVMIPMIPDYQFLVESIIAAYENKKPVNLEITCDRMSLSPKTDDNIDFIYKLQDSDISSFYYLELTSNPDTVYVFGGGHVGTAIAKILKFLDFYVILIDNRDVSEFEINAEYDEFRTMDYLEDKLQFYDFTKNYAVVATYSMQTDTQVLELIFTKNNFIYIGLMGSKTKIRLIFKKLLQKGINELFLQEIKAPIGINIHNQTPEEIAISVSAELINIKNSSHTR